VFVKDVYSKAFKEEITDYTAPSQRAIVSVFFNDVVIIYIHFVF